MVLERDEPDTRVKTQETREVFSAGDARFFRDDIRSAPIAVSQNHGDIIVVPANGHKADLEDTKGCA
jgi:hypothetical protein